MRSKMNRLFYFFISRRVELLTFKRRLIGGEKRVWFWLKLTQYLYLKNVFYDFFRCCKYLLFFCYCLESSAISFDKIDGISFTLRKKRMKKGKYFFFCFDIWIFVDFWENKAIDKKKVTSFFSVCSMVFAHILSRMVEFFLKKKKRIATTLRSIWNHRIFT